MSKVSREDKVKVFMSLMQQEGCKTPATTPLKMRQLAVKLIFEELFEAAEALDVLSTFKGLSIEAVDKLHQNPKADVDGDDVNELEVIDAYADIEYTTLWGVNMLGLSPTFADAFNEVCRSNDSKACDSFEDAEEGVKFWAEQGIAVTIVNSGSKFILKDENGKVKKSPKYSPADLAKYVPTA